jgi:hypothetical protein
MEMQIEPDQRPEAGKPKQFAKRGESMGIGQWSIPTFAFELATGQGAKLKSTPLAQA